MPVTLPMPQFFDPTHAHDWGFRPDPQALLEAALSWRRRFGIEPAAVDRRRVHLLVIDAQKDFCFPSGSLYVGGRSGHGAIDDCRRLAEFIYRNLGTITAITTSLDTHIAEQIFFPAFWLDAASDVPPPHTVVHVEDLRTGALRPNPAIADWLCEGDYAWLQAQVRFYCESLARKGRYELYLWPFHCLLGSEGQTLAGLIHEAQLFHAFVRQTQTWIEVKGDQPLTENYSILSPEVPQRHDGGRLAERNSRFIARLLAADAIVVAGEAASHCVKSTLDDLLEEIRVVDPALSGKVYILQDCMSSVVVPDGHGGYLADFTEQAESALTGFQNAGMHVVQSTTPMDEWVG